MMNMKHDTAFPILDASSLSVRVQRLTQIERALPATHPFPSRSPPKVHPVTIPPLENAADIILSGADCLE